MWWPASLLSAATGAIHIALGLAHTGGPRLHQSFFLGVGGLQIAWSSIAWPGGPGERLRKGALLLNLCVLGVYAFSRTFGIPPGEVFEAGRSDLIAAGFEVTLAVILTRKPDFTVPRPVAVVSTVVILVLMVIGVLAGFEGVAHFGPGGEHLH